MRGPSVAVALPVRNGAATIDAAVESICAQTLADIEICVVDDASTDDTAERLAAWADRDARIRVLAGPGRGLQQALNIAIEAATAPVVARMDADDRSHPERLAKS